MHIAALKIKSANDISEKIVSLFSPAVIKLLVNSIVVSLFAVDNVPIGRKAQMPTNRAARKRYTVCMRCIINLSDMKENGLPLIS